MRESVEAYERRTGASYRPPPALRSIGEPLGREDDCPTLYRYPGPVGLKDYFLGTTRTLAPQGATWTWFAEFPEAAGTSAVDEFGMVAVLEPMRLQPCATEESGVFVAEASLPAESGHLWVPPDHLADRGEVPWDALMAREAAVDAIGDVYDERREVVGRKLDAYLEELSALAGAGVDEPDAPWCDVPDEERRQIVESADIQAPWTRATRS